MVLASFADPIVGCFSFLLFVICFTIVSGHFTTISWSGGRAVSGRAVAPVMFVGASLSIGTPACCYVWLVSFGGFLLTIKLYCFFNFSEDVFHLILSSLVTVATISRLNW